MSEKGVFSFLAPKTEILYFMGIGGVSMSALAMLAKREGLTVLGSDAREGENVFRLRREGISVNIGHGTENLRGLQPESAEIVYSAAIPQDCAELCEARRRGFRVRGRAELLGEVVRAHPRSIGISGMHGKSTVCGMTGECFVRAGAEPSILCGAVMPSFGCAFRVGAGRELIFEACEYKDSFLSFNPTVAAITNIEAEHLDYFRDIGHIRRSFERYARGAERVVMNVDCPETAELYRRLGGDFITCSLNGESAEITARNALESRGFWEFSLIYNGEDCGRVKLSVPGRHNVSNALVAAGVSLSEGLAPEAVVSALCDFRGISRRLEYKGSLNGALIYDDYAHHPTEIKATLAAVRAMGFRKVICAFQPHTYSRTALLFSDFTAAFEDADTVIFTDIYAAREENVYGVSSRQLADAVKNGIYAPTDGDVKRIFREMAAEGVALLTMGAAGR